MFFLFLTSLYMIDSRSIHITTKDPVLSFLWLSYVSWYGYVTFCLPVRQMLVDIWDVSTFCLFETHHYEHSCTFLCWHMFTFLVCISLRVEWVGHMVTLYITFWGIAKLFPKRWQRFPFPSSTFENSDCSILTFTCYLLSVRFSRLSGCDMVSRDFDSHNQLYI